MTNTSSDVAAIQASGVSKTFNSGETEELVALENIDVSVAPGEFVSLIGPSGCGKSTLLRLVADLVQPTSGDVTVFGKPAAQARQDRDYGMAFQAAGLFSWRTVARNVELPLELMEWSKAERAQRSAEMLSMVQLSEFGRHFPRQLSGGMQQRVAIARALSFRPRLLLMDEPFGALDEMTREHMQHVLLDLVHNLGTTVIFVTHSIAEAAFLSDRVVVLSPRPGRVHDIVDVQLGERTAETRQSPDFFKVATRIRESLRGVDSSDNQRSSSGEPGSAVS